MHHHLQYLAILPATGIAILGYIALYCANNSQGRMQAAGKILAGWAFLLAILIIALVILHPPMGDGPLGPDGPYGHMSDPSTTDQSTPGDQTAPPPTPDVPPPASAAPPADAPPPASTPAPPTSNPTGWKTE